MEGREIKKRPGFPGRFRLSKYLPKIEPRYAAAFSAEPSTTCGA
jgi:hypothetical protein